MTSRLAVLLALVAGCSQNSESTAGKEAAGAAGASAVDGKAAGATCADPAACEKGCAGGRLEDCHELAWRKVGARGTAIDVAGAEKLLARACAGKLVKSCGMAAWLEAGRGAELAADRRAGLDRDCRAGDGWSCAALASWALQPASTGGTMRDAGAGASWTELGCTAGHLWSCATLDRLVASVAQAPDEKASTHERRETLRRLADDKRKAACAAGRREGCREGSPEYLVVARRDCAAADHGACAELVSYLKGEERQRAARDACEAGKMTEFCPLARGGCEPIDIASSPHLSLKTLPRLTGTTRGGARFDSAALRPQRRLFLFTASWNQPGTVADLEPLAQALLPLEVQVVAVLSDASWDAVHDLEGARVVTAVLDPPAPGGTIGRYTSRLGITKVPEGFLVDESGAVRRHIVGAGLITDPDLTRQCAVEVLGAPRDGKQP